MSELSMKEMCLAIARAGCLVPPDGGEPSDAEREVSERIADAIAAIPVAPDHRKWRARADGRCYIEDAPK